MRRKWKLGITCLVVFALLAALCLGCGDDGDEKSTAKDRVTITIGVLTDVTGAAASAIQPTIWALEDVVRHHNEAGTIPGVQVKTAVYDNKTDPARDIPGYEWLRERADLIMPQMNWTAEALKPFAERDKMAMICTYATTAIVEPPGWLFSIAFTISNAVKAFLRWISDEHWDKAEPAKVGHVDWSNPDAIETDNALKEYCEAHPDEFEWVGGFLAPVGAMSWAGEVEKLKDCDYVYVGVGLQAGPFAKQFRAAGHTTTFIGGDAMAAFRGLALDIAGWDAFDGAVAFIWSRWWNDTCPSVELAKDLLDKYRPGQAEDIIYSGHGYLGSAVMYTIMIDILRQTVERVGAENVDGQAIYDTCVSYKTTFEGYPEIGFTETRRDGVKYFNIYEWRAAEDDLVRVSDWIRVSE